MSKGDVGGDRVQDLLWVVANQAEVKTLGSLRARVQTTGAGVLRASNWTHTAGSEHPSHGREGCGLCRIVTVELQKAMETTGFFVSQIWDVREGRARMAVRVRFTDGW